jgi:hypothetical protein
MSQFDKVNGLFCSPVKLKGGVKTNTSALSRAVGAFGALDSGGLDSGELAQDASARARESVKTNLVTVTFPPLRPYRLVIIRGNACAVAVTFLPVLPHPLLKADDIVSKPVAFGL